MALRHSDRHLDPHGHRHGPRRDELHGGSLALGLGFATRPSQHSTPITNATRPKARALGRAYEEVVPTM